jgi:hypothetical protein
MVRPVEVLLTLRLVALFFSQENDQIKLNRARRVVRLLFV